LHEKAGKLGLLGVAFPEEVGGGGGSLADAIAVVEEMHYSGGSGGLVASLLTCGIALPHIVAAGNYEQVEQWVRPTLEGRLIGSLAITEPDGGSDVASLRTTARRDGDHFIVNGAKSYITSGCRADFVTTAVRTDGPGAHGISLLVIERGTPGFEVERLTLAVQAYAGAQRALDLTVEWCRARETFGRPLISRQTVQHTLTEMARRIDVARVYVHEVVRRAEAGDDVIAEVCFAKNTAVEAGQWVCDQALQLHGGLGYLREAEVERQYRDQKILAIGGGTTEILTSLASKRLGFTA
jgi:acyl-CoA dehydrogenase